MHMRTLLRPIGWALTGVGVVALAVGGLLAAPLRQPPMLASIHDGAVAVGNEGRPDLSRFQARDGSWLAYRLYPAAGGATDKLAIVVHGSAGSGADMHAVARALAEHGVVAVAIDTRGHGASGTRGDIGYLGQLDDDLADLTATLRTRYPAAHLTLIGHSSGGGFALRIAAGPQGGGFEHVVLLAPYLGHSAPTNRPFEGAAHWADADVPRIVALSVIHRLGVDWLDAMPVIAFAVSPGASAVTRRYSYRLLTNFGPPADWRAAFAVAPAPIDVIGGERDELMVADQYRTALAPYAAKVHVTLLPGIDHMGVSRAPAALAAIVAAVTRPAATAS